MTDQVKFDAPKHESSIIKVIGVGGGGTNAVNHMYNLGITGVDFIVCNTDSQSLETSPVPVKLQLGRNITGGRGAGSIPEQGRNAALENIDELREILQRNTKMLFITAGMGGGTGTGGSPVIASVARELDILTVGIVTMPFAFEGRKRLQQAEKGIQELRNHVDTLLIILNDRLRDLHSNLTLSEAFGKADDILATAAKGIAELITVHGYVNVDFEDVNTVMRKSGVALMGSGTAEGEDRAKEAVEQAITSPLLNDSDVNGASNILLYISSGKEEIQMEEVIEITDLIRDRAGQNADVIWGHGFDESLGNKIAITLIATGFEPRKKDAAPPAPKLPVQKTDLYGDKAAEKPEEKEAPKEEPATEFKFYEKPAPATTLNFLNEGVNLNDPFSSSFSTDYKLPEPVRKLENSKENTPEKSEEIRKEENPRPAETAKTTGEVRIAGPESLIEVNSHERRQKLKDMSLKLKKPTDVMEMEKQPAYLRRNVKLNDSPASSESAISRFSLTETDKNGAEIKTNNSFLHDNID